MGTRSIIAKQDGDAWKGRYAHWDGYPAHQGKTIWDIVQRDGYETAVNTLVNENFYWSALDANHGDTALSESRWINVKGYGVAGNDEQASPDEWYTPADMLDCWIDYIYIVTVGGLWVISVQERGNVVLGIFRWDENEPNWGKVQNSALEDNVTIWKMVGEVTA